MVESRIGIPLSSEERYGSTAEGTAKSFRLTLDDAVSRTLSNQPLILQAEFSVAAALAGKREAESAYLPKVSGTASYFRVEPQEGDEFDFKPFLPIDIKSKLTPLDAMDFHVGFSELVFDFGKREAQVRLAGSRVDAASIDLDQIRTGLAYQAAQVFYSALFLRSKVKAIDEQLVTLNQHLEDTKVRERTGSSTHYDVLTTQVRVAAVLSERIDAETQYEKHIIALQQLTGIADDLELIGGFEPQRESVDSTSAVSKAIAGRDEMKQALASEKQAELALNLAKLGSMPSLSAEARAGYKNGILTFSNTDPDNLLFTWDMGVMLSVPIFDGLVAARKSEEASAKVRAARESSEALRRSVAMQVLQAVKDLESSRKQTENSLARLAQAEEALNTAKVQYDVGVSTNVQYLDSQTSLEIAKLDNLSAVYHEVLYALALKQALGERLGE